jgi:DNA-binding transcriptional LysR family regulator
MVLRAACHGFGVAFVTEGQAAPFLADGQLVRLLESCCPPFTANQPACDLFKCLRADKLIL